MSAQVHPVSSAVSNVIIFSHVWSRGDCLQLIYAYLGEHSKLTIGIFLEVRLDQRGVVALADSPPNANSISRCGPRMPTASSQIASRLLACLRWAPAPLIGAGLGLDAPPAKPPGAHRLRRPTGARREALLDALASRAASKASLPPESGGASLPGRWPCGASIRSRREPSRTRPRDELKRGDGRSFSA